MAHEADSSLERKASTDTIYSVAMTADSSRLASASWDGTVGLLGRLFKR
jgi:hypothetical protein